MTNVILLNYLVSSLFYGKGCFIHNLEEKLLLLQFNLIVSFY